MQPQPGTGANHALLAQAFARAQQQHQVDPASGPGDPAGGPYGPDPTGAPGSVDPHILVLGHALTTLQHLLIAKGVISAQELTGGGQPQQQQAPPGAPPQPGM